MKRQCLNAKSPDKYGHYREAKYCQTKHHWFWKVSTCWWSIYIGAWQAGGLCVMGNNLGQFYWHKVMISSLGRFGKHFELLTGPAHAPRCVLLVTTVTMMTFDPRCSWATCLTSWRWRPASQDRCCLSRRTTTWCRTSYPSSGRCTGSEKSTPRSRRI